MRAARLEPRGARAPRRRGRGDRARAGLDRGRARPRPRATGSAIPTATASSSTTSASATSRPSICARAEEPAAALLGRGAAVKRLDHVNVLAADVRANREFAQEQLGYRLYERIVHRRRQRARRLAGLTIAAHELIYDADPAGASGRLHHLAFWVDTREEVLRAADLFLDASIHIEAAPSKHAIAQGFFLYGTSPAATASRSRPAATSSSTPPSRRSSGPRPSARAARPGACRRSRPSTPTARPTSAAPPPGRRSRRPRDSGYNRNPRMNSVDRQLIRDLVENWAVWRDAGDWERFATVWHDDGLMMATWFQGPARRLHPRQPRGLRARRAHPPLPRRDLDRSRRRPRDRPDEDDDLAARRSRASQCDVVCTGRFYDFLERRDGPLGDRAAPADLREGPRRPGRPGGDGSSSSASCSPASPPATATSPTCRPRSATRSSPTCRA